MLRKLFRIAGVVQSSYQDITALLEEAKAGALLKQSIILCAIFKESKKSLDESPADLLKFWPRIPP